MGTAATARRHPVPPLAGPPTVECVHGLTVCEGCRIYRPIGPWRGVALAAPVLAPTRIETNFWGVHR